MNKILFLSFLLATNSLMGQDIIKYPYKKDSSIIKVEGYYQGYGKIFGVPFSNKSIPRLKYRIEFEEEIDYHKDWYFHLLPKIKLTKEDILKCENILFENYAETVKNEVLDAKEYFFTYYRQYVGFYNKKNERCIYLCLLNFKSKRKSKNIFWDWSYIFFSVHSHNEYIDMNREMFVVNLNTNNLEIY